MSPWGHLLCVGLIKVRGQEGLCILMHEPSLHNYVIVIVSPLLGVIAAIDEELV